MSTTTIRLTDELKARVARATTELAEQRASFHAQAQERLEELGRSGKAVPWSEMRRYLQERAEGLTPARPKARKLVAPEACWNTTR